MSDIKEELAKRASSLRKKESGNEPQREEAVDGAGGEKAFVRLLRADEIECRVSTINERGLSLLLLLFNQLFVLKILFFKQIKRRYWIK